MERDLLILSVIVKLFLIPAYRSTDFEVHRNWLAITSSLPLSEWYYESTSIWTLDYPPFFAWFEYALSWFASLFDADMLKVENLDYATGNTVMFQRLSVIASELVLWLAVESYTRTASSSKFTVPRRILMALLLLNPGLIYVDNIHFQYNGFLFGILLWSIAFINGGRDLLGGALFAVLLNFKHIYLYVAPAYFVYLLRHLCFPQLQKTTEGVRKLVLLGSVVIGVFVLSFGPVLAAAAINQSGKIGGIEAAMEALQQIGKRLFPFKRGLCHAYWAPNVYALYAAIDRGLILVAKLSQLPYDESAAASITRGFVGDIKFAILPDVPPWITLLCTIASQLPCLVNLWRQPTPPKFIGSIVLCAYGSFLFGWHVHEKAVLLVILPFTLIATSTIIHFKMYIILSVSGYFSLFPLLFRPAEMPIKVILLVLYSLVGTAVLGQLSERNSTTRTTSHGTGIFRLFSMHERIYLMGFLPVWIFSEIVHPLFFPHEMPFLPLALVSLYSTVGVIYSWVRLYREFLMGPRQIVAPNIAGSKGGKKLGK